jgi:hypothetical protein
MVTALRSGPPPVPPAQPNRAADAARLPDFARNLRGAEAGTRTGAAATPAQASQPPAAVAPRSAAETDPNRPMRPPRPGSLVDIRV